METNIRATRDTPFGQPMLPERLFADVMSDPAELIKLIKAGGSFHVVLAEAEEFIVRAAYLSREGVQSFDPAVHLRATDIYIILRGEAVITTGGKLVEPSQRKDEIDGDTLRGKAISGGKSRKVRPFEVITIPPGTPHSMSVAEGNKQEVFFYNIKQKR